MALDYYQVIYRLSLDQTFTTADSRGRRLILEQELNRFGSILNVTYPDIFHGFFLLEYGSPIAYCPQPGLDEPTSLRISTPLLQDGEEIGWAFAYEDKAVVTTQLNELRLMWALWVSRCLSG